MIKNNHIKGAALALSFAGALSACSDGGKSSADAMSNGGIDSPAGTIDSRPAGALPTWKLLDVQPQSPKTGQTYGLETFSNKVVVVTLLQGF
jgi:hypothetical protein